ncbi:MAG: glycoside hydrolase family 13 protein [Pygmaiobacter sp.]|nr:glycoside hydrolase family 13 protein [Pygmaiobacter sp.]
MNPRIYNSRDLRYKSPFGAVPRGSTVTFHLAVPRAMHCKTPYLCLRVAGQQKPALTLLAPAGSRGEDDLFELAYTPAEVGTCFYWFDLYINYTKVYRGDFGEGYLSQNASGPLYQLTVYDEAFTTPQTAHGAVMYQIFPDRFYEGVPKTAMPFADRTYRADKDGEPYFWPNEVEGGLLNRDYYGGDFVGIQAKLPYLASLGVTLLYLNPIVEAHANHRYNTADYRKPDPLLGTQEEFHALCEAAKAQGIGIVLDGVFSHTGSDSIYFNKEGRYGAGGAWRDKNSPTRAWYFFSPQYRSGYRSWWGFDSLPEVNEEEPSFREFICGPGGVIDYWMDLGASGFRLDVADELPDDFIEAIRTAVKRHGQEKLLIGEVWEDATNKVSYGNYRTYLLGRGLDTVMNYPLREAILGFVRGGDSAQLARTVLDLAENYPPPALHVAMNLLSTHDTVRAVTALAGEAVEGHDRYWQSGRRLDEAQLFFGRRLLRLAFCLLYTLPGIPCVYYGDEIAMQGYKDPFNRGYYNWNDTDDTLRDTLRTLAAARKEHPVFSDGEFQLLRAQTGVFVFARRGKLGRVVVAVNRTAHPLKLPEGGSGVVLPPYEFGVFGG